MKQIACIDAHALWIPGQQGLHDVKLRDEFFSAPQSIRSLLAVADGWNIAQLWVHKSFLDRVGDILMEPGRWDIRPELPEKNGWYHAFIPGHYGPGVDLVIPAWPVGYERESIWNSAPDGQALISQVQAYNMAMRFDYRYTPGSTGTSLIRHLHTGPGAITLESPKVPPPPVHSNPSPGRDIAWIRGLTAAEQEYQYLHAFDKNAMYLGACAALELGVGGWVYKAEPPYLDEIETGVPGYWHVTSSHLNNIELAHGLPDLIAPDGIASGDMWVTTPVLRCAIEHHYDISCSEAYVWPAHHRMLASWQARLRVARQELRFTDKPLAQDIFKLTYSMAIAHLDGSWLRNSEEPDPLYRPDWRHAVIGQAAANIWRNMVQASQAGVHVVGCATDCMYVVSDLNAEETAKATGIKFGPNIGEFKIAQGDIPMDDIRQFFDPTPDLWALRSYLVKRSRGHVVSPAS